MWFKQFLKQLRDWVFDKVTILIGKINWNDGEYKVTEAEMDTIRQMLAKNYYIILTRHDGHLSTYAVGFAHWVLTGKWGHYAHALMNLEGEVVTDADFRMIEATGVGVHYSTFDEVFTCDSIALLKPKCMTIEKWTSVLDKLKSNLGKPYDTLFDLAQDQAFSCVSLVRNALMAEPNYHIDFANFEAMIAKEKNLDPNMLYECPDFEIVWETRH
jgi:hypothetical protein